MKALLATLGLLVFSHGNAQTPTDSTVLGTEFIFAYPINIAPIALYVTINNNNPTPANPLVTSYFQQFEDFQTVVAARSSRKINVTLPVIQTLYNNTNLDRVTVERVKGIRIQTDVPVSVIATSGDFPSSDSFYVLPTSVLGTRYRAVSSRLTRTDNGPNFITVVSYADNTQITVGTFGTVTLDSLDTVSIPSFSSLSGTLITGTRPFAVISGCMTGFTLDTDAGSYEAVMLRPTSSWGNLYVSQPFRYTTRNQFIAVSDSDNNVVTYPGGVVRLDTGVSAALNCSSGSISSSGPLQLIQLGQNTGPDNSNLGDAFMLPVPTLSQFSSSPVYFMPCGAWPASLQQPIHHFIRLFTTQPYIGVIGIDSLSINAMLWTLTSVPNVYYYEQLISSDTHVVTSSNPNAIFAVLTYSYSFSAGCGFWAAQV